MNKATKEILDGVYDAVETQTTKDITLQIQKTFLKKLKTMYEGDIITAADLLEYAGSKGITVDSPEKVKKVTQPVSDPCTRGFIRSNC